MRRKAGMEASKGRSVCLSLPLAPQRCDTTVLEAVSPFLKDSPSPTGPLTC
jgi:hypothetical protein